LSLICQLTSEDNKKHYLLTWATDSDLELAYTEIKDGDGYKVGPSSGLMYLHTSTVTTSYYTQVQCQTLTTRKYSVNVVTTYTYNVKLVTTHK